MRKIIPVLLGADLNCYSIARAFHEAFGVTSFAFGKYPLGETEYSKIVTFEKAEGLSGEDSVEATIALTVEADRQVKQLLNQVFGGDNDFDKALGGVNLLATAGNGQRVMTNLMTLLENILAEGAERFAQDKADAIRQGR